MPIILGCAPVDLRSMGVIGAAERLTFWERFSSSSGLRLAVIPVVSQAVAPGLFTVQARLKLGPNSQPGTRPQKGHVQKPLTSWP
jgi:hypothetical protein